MRPGGVDESSLDKNDSHGCGLPLGNKFCYTQTKTLDYNQILGNSIQFPLKAIVEILLLELDSIYRIQREVTIDFK